MLRLSKKISKTSIISISSIVILLLGLLSFYFLSMWNNATPPAVKKIYYVDHISRAHRMVIDRFNEIHKGEIKVEAIDLSFEKFSTNERKELLARYMRSKNDKIDVFAADQIWAHRFARWAEPLDKYFNSNERKNILSYALNSCYYKNHLVAVPLFMDIALMYYRKDIIDKLNDSKTIESSLKNSMTWSDFIKLGERLSKDGRPFFTYQADSYEGLVCSYLELMAQQNKSLFENDTLQLDSPESKRAVNLLVDLVHKFKLSPDKVAEFNENSSYKYFMAKNGIFIRAWPNFPRDYQATNGKDYRMKFLEKVPLPHFVGYKPAAITGGWNLMISKYSKRKPEALEFVKFLMSGEAQKIMYEYGGYLPTNNQIYEDSLYLVKYPDLQYYKKYFRIGVHRPYMVQYTKLSDIISHFINLAIKKDLTVDDALRQASRLIENHKFYIE